MMMMFVAATECKPLRNVLCNRLGENNVIALEKWLQQHDKKIDCIIDKVLEDANQKAIDTLGLDGKKFEDRLGMNKLDVNDLDKNKFLGLNKWLLIGSAVVIAGAIGYKIYNNRK
jgi:hypothetical protein